LLRSYGDRSRISHPQDIVLEEGISTLGCPPRLPARIPEPL